MKELADRVVVITGAASGIGRATAEAFAQERCRVHLVDIDGPGLSEARAGIAQAGGRASIHEVDCTDAAAMAELAGRIHSREGRTDVLHNNAGVCVGGAAERLTLEDWRWITDVNYWGVIHGIQAFLPRMVEQGGGGHIVNTASMAGLVGLPYVAPYCATKFAVVGLSEALGVELAHHDIGVTAVCTGMVRTNVARSGRIVLPSPWDERFAGAFERWGAPPRRVARRIVRAVRRGETLVVVGGEMAPLWWLRGASVRGYHGVARFFARSAMRRAGVRRARGASGTDRTPPAR
jgi:NAD(P)-dependent dehydrogenase (short-subunit alcohol dehydrogenase family)